MAQSDVDPDILAEFLSQQVALHRLYRCMFEQFDDPIGQLHNEQAIGTALIQKLALRGLSKDQCAAVKKSAEGRYLNFLDNVRDAMG